ncbi:SDR family NAD(P)-dependent oxidoreductase [Lacimicrobium alkaliphilum]|uniref:Short-chain dehydrogenase n=1 Tax=Lacimicrobium alkaliphilum TaxID=1526571 RepID=A0ABQ1R9W5_9ALTE|nr:SDR family NAD(P)-dependent oxidoreductase [Lacimicrobium alkaliphilum]GGD59074.1 short-chain dehydrogenase [Lacimicrobium alkaliphilum]
MKTTMIVGAGGGLGKALATRLGKDNKNNRVLAISRQPQPDLPASVEQFQIPEQDDSSIGGICRQLVETVSHIDQFICCVGLLHEGELQPEKKLEHLNAEHLHRYFAVNSIIPALWLKHLPALVDAKRSAVIAFLSARVGSITDNRLGGWYGYRSSKAALNMLIKTAQVEYRRRCPGVALVSYHPGTVDTPLSAPFQDRVPAHKLFKKEEAAGYLLSQLEGLTSDQAPYYLDWQGKPIPW